MLQPSPKFPNAINAVLHHVGYSVRALGPKMSAPAGIEKELAEKFELPPGVPAPDVLANAPNGAPLPAFECKASSFGTESTTSNQARKLLARSVDLSLVVGAAPGKTVPGAVVYVTRAAQTSALVDTLAELRAEFEERDMASAPGSVIGISNPPGEGVTVEFAGGQLPGPAGDVLSTRQVIIPAVGEDEVARPLYLVPYDPGVQQTDEEHDRCLRILLERARAHMVSVIGRSDLPATVVLDGMQILSDATYGLSAYWRETNDRDGAARAALGFAKKALRQIKPTPPDVVEPPGNPPRIEVHLTSDAQRDNCANGLLAAALPGDLNTLEDPQQELDLFSQGEDRPAAARSPLSS